MRLTLLLICIIALLGCAEGQYDPTGATAAFTGITPTDQTGAVAGPTDSNDWQVADGPTTLPVDRSDIIGWRSPSGSIQPAGKVVPSQIAVRPGFPNPTEGQFTIVHEVPAPCIIRTWVLDNSMKTVYREQENAVAAGNWVVFFNFSGGQQLFKKGIYRVVYEYDFGEDQLHGYGDVLYTELNEQPDGTHQN